MAMKGSVLLCLLWSAVLLSTRLLTTSAGEVKIQKKDGYIVDIKTSTRNGAKLLGGLRAQDVHACVQECAGQEACDMAVVKLEGYSDTGKNCYLLACTGNCVTAEHNGFASFLLEKSSQSKEDEGEGKKVASVFVCCSDLWIGELQYGRTESLLVTTTYTRVT